MTAGRDARSTAASQEPPPTAIKKYQPPPDGTWTADAEIADAQTFTDNALGAAQGIAVRDGKPAGAPQRIRRDLGRFLPLGITSSGDYYYGLRAGGSQVYVADLESKKITEVPILKSSSAPEWSSSDMDPGPLSLKARLR